MVRFRKRTRRKFESARASPIPEILEIEKRTNHDVIAFLENVATSVGPAARWIHQGLTSSDILDTTLAVQMIESSRILLGDIGKLRSAVADQARRFKMTPMIGRSHGIHAEPITFGLKLALMYDEFGRAEQRLTQTRSASGSASSVERSARMLTSIRPSRKKFARSWDSRLPRFPRRSSSAIVTRNS